MVGKNIVVLGGGFGGAAAARSLRRLLPAEHTVTLVDRQRRTYLCGSMPWLVVGEREPNKISRSLGALVQRGVSYLEAEVDGLDLEGRAVVTRTGPLPFDFLIIATGAEYDWSAIPGAAEAHSFYNLQTARKLRDAVRRFKGGRIVISVSRAPYKCPPAPYEAAMLLDEHFRQRGTRRSVDIVVTTPEPAPLRILGAERSAEFKAYLERRGVSVRTDHFLREVDASQGAVAFSSGVTLSADVVVTIPVHRSASFVREAGLANDSGWAPVNPATLETHVEGVYAIGDVNVVMMANGNPLPKAGVFAADEGETVARNIAADILGGETHEFAGEGYCFVDHGAGKGALVRGAFLAQEGPAIELTSPSVRWRRKKERFEADWRAWRI